VTCYQNIGDDRLSAGQRDVVSRQMYAERVLPFLRTLRTPLGSSTPSVGELVKLITVSV
jgi:hypothetical protein